MFLSRVSYTPRHTNSVSPADVSRRTPAVSHLPTCVAFRTIGS